MHIVHPQDGVSGARCEPRHGPQHIQPGLRPLFHVGGVGCKGQLLVYLHTKVLVNFYLLFGRGATKLDLLA